VAWAARRLGMAAHVVVPAGAIDSKCAFIAQHGADLHRHGADLDEAAARARSLARELGLPYFEDGADEAQLAGTGTIGAELSGVRADTVLVPVGVGALAGGIARALAPTPRPPRVIGVQSSAFSRLASVLAGEPDPERPRGSTFADGLADNRLVDPAFSACRAYLDDVLTVDDAALMAALRELWHARRLLVEGAAAAPLAALRVHGSRVHGQRVVLVVSGANLDPSIARRITGSSMATRPRT
jgi:threonine dehydratase